MSRRIEDHRFHWTPGEMEHRKEGDWVLWSDHKVIEDQLRAIIDRLQKENADLRMMRTLDAEVMKGLKEEIEDLGGRK